MDIIGSPPTTEIAQPDVGLNEVQSQNYVWPPACPDSHEEEVLTDSYPGRLLNGGLSIGGEALVLSLVRFVDAGNLQLAQDGSMLDGVFANIP